MNCSARVSRWIVGLVIAVAMTPSLRAAPLYEDRFVWVFGWGLGRDADVTEICRVIETGAKAGLNGAVMSLGLDTLCRQGPDFFRRLETVQRCCETNRVELIPAVFSVGYGGGILSHDRNLAEGLPVVDAPFVVRGGEARVVRDPDARVINGGFEEFTGHRFPGYSFHDQPGVVSFADPAVKRTGNASVRLEGFGANPHGHGRVMQQVAVKPRRCYRFSLWVKTEELHPVNALRVVVLAGERELAPRTFNLQPTTDWRRLSVIFNSGTNTQVRLYAGLWEGKGGKVWLDDWSLEEAGPVNLLRRPGTPIAVRSEDGTVTYEEGVDFAPFRDPDFNPWRGDGAEAPLKLLPGGRIREGERLRVSWYHSQLIHDSQVTVCLGEPALYDIFEHEAKLLAERLRPRRVFLNMDEVRMGGTCRACAGSDMAALLGESIARQAAAIRRHSPEAEVYVWSDMFDPHHNARDGYYLVEGDFTGSWKHLPNDLVLAVWGGEPRERSLKFFADEGYRTLVACYYDAPNLDTVKGWLKVARPVPRVRGFMYTPWEKNYRLLPEFGALLQE